MSRPWLALVLVLFCLPLFVGLRSLDLETDEAIYSFAVDRMLEAGEWMRPKSSPSETEVFLEKPPLKFWMVAAPIRVGLLPLDEFGLRFWDALCGGVAFLYVFAIGGALAGPVCGAVAVLLLFVHAPLVFDHGLRTNNMEAPLFLAYCGGVFHFIRWGAAGESRRGAHAVTAGLYFVLGFMTKFVAAMFLPAVLGLSALLVRPTRARLMADWRLWVAVAGLVLLLVAPWFVYAQAQFGGLLWETMLAEHVYARFTTGLNPAHVHPWNYYLVTMAGAFTQAGARWLVPLGVVTLIVQSVRRRWFEGTVVVLWAAFPLVLISLGTSKLYHYAYPFLPPLTLAAGYLVALVVMIAPVPLRRWAHAVEDWIARHAPRLSAAGSRPWAQRAGTAVVWGAAAIALGAVLFGQVRLTLGHVMLFKSSGVYRPVLAILLAGLLTRRSARVASLVVVLIVAAWMPVALYQDTFRQLSLEKHPLRDASDCIRRVETRLSGAAPPGLYVDTDSSMWHPIYYYFRRIQPWTRQQAPSPERLAQYVQGQDPAVLRPSLVQELRYRDYLAGPAGDRLREGGSPPMISLLEYALLLPGPYRACSPEASLVGSD